MNITNIIGKEIKDSRGNGTLEVSVYADDYVGTYSVPSGASTGASEAYELRDEVTQGMTQAISRIETIIKPALIGIDVTNQKRIDELLLVLDGTEHKTRLGGNTLIGVSIACAVCAAHTQGVEVYEYLRSLGTSKGTATPLLYINLINGGKHSHTKLAFQEYHIVPQTESVHEALAIADKIISALETILSNNNLPLTKGDEGGYAVPVEDVRIPLQFLHEAIETCGYADKVRLALDVAATSFYKDGTYTIADMAYTQEQLAKLYIELIRDFHLLSIEDPFYEEGFADFAQHARECAPTFFVGDDLTTTNITRLKRAIDEHAIGGIIIKPNQIGTLTETINAIMYAQANDIRCIVSHRSGETFDDFIADLVVAFGCYGIKAGSPKAPERAVKYNRLATILKN